jgi:environmental stress-induced protein Ves
MRLIRDAEQIRMPWKNGGGETIEIARGPEGSTLDSFDWRISSARIDRPGACSRFDGIDRTLAVLDGEGVLLSIEGGQEVSLTAASPPFSFDGGASIHSGLLRGPVTDLNVMTKRGRCSHSVERMTARRSSLVSDLDSAIVVLFSTGHAVVEMRHFHARLEPNDAAILARDDVVTVTPEGAGKVYRIEIRSLDRLGRATAK